MTTTQEMSSLGQEKASLLDSASEPHETSPLSLKSLQTWYENVLQLLIQRKSLFLVLVSAFINAVRATMTKAIINDIHPIAVTAIGRAITCLCCFPLIIYNRTSPVIGKTEFAYILLSGTLHALSNTAITFSYKFLEVADTAAVVSSKAAFVAVLGTIILRERLSKVDVLSVVLSVTALVLLAKPLTLFNHVDALFVEGLFLATSSAVLGAMNTVSKRLIGINKVDPQIALMYTALISSTATGALGAILGVLAIPSDLTPTTIVVFSGLLGYCANVLNFVALWTEYALYVTVVDSSKIIFVFLLQLFIFKVQPDIFSFTGGILMVLSFFAFSFKTVNVDES